MYCFRAKTLKTLPYTCLNPNIQSTPNNNYNLFYIKLTNAINNNSTTKYVKYNKFNHKNNPWLTSGILKSMKYRDKLYFKLKNPHN